MLANTTNCTLTRGEATEELILKLELLLFNLCTKDMVKN